MSNKIQWPKHRNAYFSVLVYYSFVFVMSITFFHFFHAIAKCPLPPPCPELFLLSTTSHGMEYPFGQFGPAIQEVSPDSLLPHPAYSLLEAEERNKTLILKVRSKTYSDVPGYASNLVGFVELVCDLTKDGCLTYTNETQQHLALFLGLACAIEPLFSTIMGAEEEGPLHLGTPCRRDPMQADLGIQQPNTLFLFSWVTFLTDGAQVIDSCYGQCRGCHGMRAWDEEVYLSRNRR